MCGNHGRYVTDRLSFANESHCLPCGETFEVYACGGDYYSEASWEVRPVAALLLLLLLVVRRW